MVPTRSMGLVKEPLAFIEVPVGVNQSSNSDRLVSGPLTFLDGAVIPDLHPLASSLLEVARPLTHIDGPVLDAERPPFDQIVCCLGTQSQLTGLALEEVEGSGRLSHFVDGLVVQQVLHLDRIIEPADWRLYHVLLPDLVAADYRLETDEPRLELGDLLEVYTRTARLRGEPVEHGLLAYDADFGLLLVLIQIRLETLRQILLMLRLTCRCVIYALFQLFFGNECDFLLVSSALDGWVLSVILLNDTVLATFL